MSTHNLQQFDEALLDEIGAAGEAAEIREALNERQRGRAAGLASVRFSQRELVVVVIAAIISAISFLYAIQARHRAKALQERLDAFEAQISR
jgi:hypothetical protein